MRTAALVIGLVMWCGVADAQQPPQGTPPLKLFSSSVDVQGLIARAKRDRKPDQAIFVLPILQLAPFTANLEYRVADVRANASVHDRDAEMFYVIEGAGTLVTGGTLRDERRTNAENLTGTAIDNGSARSLVKGDFVVVPEGTPHWFTKIEGTLVMMSLHLPRGAAQGAR